MIAWTLFSDAVAVNGSFYGRGTGTQLTVCSAPFTNYDFVPITNCSTADRTCSHDRDVGLRCSPGRREYLHTLKQSTV